MKSFTIGYPIHNKGHMVDEIINGLVNSIDQDKHDVKYQFIFDGCTDNSLEVFKAESFRLRNVEYIETDNLFQLRTNNLLMKGIDTDFLIIFQDDMVLIDKNFIDNILKIYDIYGDSLGVIGCRDGFDSAYSNMYGSKFSESPNRRILKSGEYKERMMINIGPIVLTKETVEYMGYFDEIYDNGAYEEMEYSLKCYLNGFINIVLGVDIIHSKFDHKNKNKVTHTDSSVLKDMYRLNHTIFRERWYNIAKI